MSKTIIKWIEDKVNGLTFADIGGIGLRSINERISTAIINNAESATMIDLRKKDFKMWNIFHETMKQKAITGYKTIENVDVTAPDLHSIIGEYDFVHCAGIMYHLPSPLLAMQNLYKITKKYLVVNTVTIPEYINNAEGEMSFKGSQALFIKLSRWI